MQPETRNFLVAAALSVGVLLVWDLFFAPPPLPPSETVGVSSTPPLPQGSLPTLPVQEPASTILRRETKRIPIRNERVEGSLNPKGIVLDDLTLTDYGETTDPDSSRIRLLSPTGTTLPYRVSFGWLTRNASLPTPTKDTLWQAPANASLSPASPLTLTHATDQLTYTITLAIDENFLLTATQSVRNHTGESVELFPYTFITREGGTLEDTLYLLHEGPVAYTSQTGLEEIDYDDLHDEALSLSDTEGWLGFTDKYWAVLIAPDQQTPFNARIFHQPNTTARYQADVVHRQPTITPAHGTSTTTTHVFAGAKQTNLVDTYRTSVPIPKFDLAIDWGWLYFLTKPLFLLLDLLFGFTGSFAIAILLTTVLIRLVMFPLANKSYAAMAAMRRLQPEMMQMREQYKDDRATLNQEMMALYRREKVNPAAGCLPMLVQIPIFFSLYKVLFVTIEMRHAPFIGWIHDLSAPDPTSLFNLFGLLPFEVPAFLMIGAWPIFMGATMALQMQLSPPPPHPTQRMIFMLMPVIFTFFLATFPSGLVIYWTWNNLLSIVQQTIIMRRQGVPLFRRS